jgi:hypothetical protein
VPPITTGHQELEEFDPGLLFPLKVAVLTPVVTLELVQPFHLWAFRLVTRAEEDIVIVPKTCNAVPELAEALTPTPDEAVP